MEKRGVVLDDALIKTGSKDKVCPTCGKPLTEPSYCDSCGTKPFESRPDPKDSPKK